MCIRDRQKGLSVLWLNIFYLRQLLCTDGIWLHNVRCYMIFALVSMSLALSTGWSLPHVTRVNRAKDGPLESLVFFLPWAPQAPASGKKLVSLGIMTRSKPRHAHLNVPLPEKRHPSQTETKAIGLVFLRLFQLVCQCQYHPAR